MYVKKIRFAHSSPKGDCMVDGSAYFAEVMVVDDKYGYIHYVIASEFFYDLTIKSSNYSLIDIMLAQYDDDRVDPFGAEMQADKATITEYKTTIDAVENDHLGSHFPGLEKAVDLCVQVLSETRMCLPQPDYYDNKYRGMDIDEIKLPKLDFFFEDYEDTL